MTNDEYKFTDIDDITEKIISCAFTVSNTLGAGFLEKVYENALFIELKSNGLYAEHQRQLNVFYKEELVGEYYADLLVENKVIIELKAVKEIDNNHKAQIINYLKASGIKCGLIINFGNPKVEIKRFVYG